MAKVIFTNEQAFKALQLLIKYFKRKPDYANKSAGYRSFKWDWAATKEISGAIKILQKAKLPEGWRVRSTDKQRPDMREPIKVSSFSITAPLDFVEWKKKIKKAEVASLQDVQSYLGAAKETAASAKKIYNVADAKKIIQSVSRIFGGESPFYIRKKGYLAAIWKGHKSLRPIEKEDLEKKNISYTKTVTGIVVRINPKYEVALRDLDWNTLRQMMRDLAKKSKDVQEYIKLAKAANMLDG